MGLKNIDLFFEGNPNPMWIYDPADYSVLETNDAAVQLYGYTRPEFLSLTIKDLRPKNEIPKLVDEVKKQKQHLNDAGIWRHQKKDGGKLFVRILSTPVQVEHKTCKLVLAQDITEQIKTKKELNREKEFLDTLTQHIPGTFYIFDMDGRMVRWNRKLEKITGYSAEEVRDLDAIKYFEGQDRFRIRKAIQHAFTEGEVEVEANLCTKHGEQIPFYFSASKIELQGEPHLLGVGIDISKQNKAQQELHKQRKLLQAIMAQSGSIIFVKDVDGPYRMVNDKFRELFQTGEENIIGQTDRELFEEEEAQALISNDRKVLESGETIEFEDTVTTQEETRHFFTVKYPLKDIPGYETSICGIASDITELKKAEQELDRLYKRERKERHRLELINRRLSLLSKLNTIFLEEDSIKKAMEQACNIIVHELADLCSFDILDREGNNELQRISTKHKDKQKEEIAYQIHQKFPEFFYGSKILRQALQNRKQIFIDDFPKAIRNQDVDNKELLELLDQLEAESILIKPLLVKDREVGTMTLLLSGSQKDIVADDSLLFEELAYKIALYIDNMIVNDHIRELNESLEERVKRRTRQLEDANKELESFSYSVSHDLRSPLRAIDGYTSLLLEDYYENLDDEGQEFLTIVNDESKRMGELIDDLLSFSRMNQQQKRLQSFPMEQLVTECITEVCQANPHTEPAFHIENLPTVNADYRLIRQVWINLLGNAIKYSKPEQQPEINIRAVLKEEQNGHVFSVEDNGVGFNMKYADKLFGVFQRLHSNDQFEGTGIGLALVRRIINRHGGKVWAESEPGKGATFYFSLPIKNKQPKHL